MKNKLLYFLLFFISPVYAGTLILGAVSSTVNSGLMDYLIPYYTAETGHNVKLITGGTGFILHQLENNDIQIAICYQQEMEKELLQKFPEGKRQVFMYNSFIILGPAEDPAKITHSNSFAEAFKKINSNQALFISRGDNSGSHFFEKEIWQQLNINPQNFGAKYYLETGQDVGSTITIANNKNAYVLADYASWLAYEENSNLKILYRNDFEGKAEYSILQLQADENLSVEAQQFIAWLMQKNTLELIAIFTINGKKAFQIK